MDISQAIERLNSLLPLKPRQDELTPELKLLHQHMIHTLIYKGRVLNTQELESLVGLSNIASSLQILAGKDLIVIDEDGWTPVGAYPVTLEPTPHKILVNKNQIFAMCALDALAVAPMFGLSAIIESNCHVSETNIRIVVENDVIASSAPSRDLMLGIRWHNPGKVAAHSLCKEMVFLIDKTTALEWRARDSDTHSIFNLTDALAFAAAYFTPLMSKTMRQ